MPLIQWVSSSRCLYLLTSGKGLDFITARLVSAAASKGFLPGLFGRAPAPTPKALHQVRPENPGKQPLPACWTFNPVPFQQLLQAPLLVLQARSWRC